MKRISCHFLALMFGFTFFTTLAYASGDHIEPPQQHWSWEGVFGHFDRPSAQRGFQVYKEVCATCHGLEHVNYRNLVDIGFSMAEIKAIAAEYSVQDGPNDEGEMFERPALPSDKFVKPYPNPQAAAAANNGAVPPDLSLIVKARPDGANYLYALLTGYKEPPHDYQLREGLYYNEWFKGHQIAMPAPLTSEGQVSYQDNTTASIEQMARDVTTFLAWAAEPELEKRKQTGIRVFMFLSILALLLYLSKKKVWARVNEC